MKKIISYTLFCCLMVSFTMAQSPLEGRWDLTVSKDGKQLPSWLEVQHSGDNTLIGRFVYAFGSARPVAQVIMNNNHFSFTIPPQWEKGNMNMEFEGELKSGVIAGTMKYADGKQYPFTGVRAPQLIRNAEPVWGGADQADRKIGYE